MNEVSLTVVASKKSVQCGHHTLHVQAHQLFRLKGALVNLEFDIIGKYVSRIQELKVNSLFFLQHRQDQQLKQGRAHHQWADQEETEGDVCLMAKLRITTQT